MVLAESKFKHVIIFSEIFSSGWYRTLRLCPDKHRYSVCSVYKPTVMRWARMFSGGRQETTDLKWPSQALEVVAEKLITNIDTAIKRNRHRKIWDVSNESNVSIITAHNIVTDIQKYQRYNGRTACSLNTSRNNVCSIRCYNYY